MFIEWWVIIALILISGIWAEIRHGLGYREGFKDGFKDIDLKSEMIGSAKLVKALSENHIIKFLDDGTFIGFNNNEWNAITGKKYNPIIDGDREIEQTTKLHARD